MKKTTTKLVKFAASIIVINSTVLCLLFAAILYIWGVNENMHSRILSQEYSNAIKLAIGNTEEDAKKFSELNLNQFNANEILALKTIHEMSLEKNKSAFSSITNKINSVYSYCKEETVHFYEHVKSSIKEFWSTLKNS